MFVFLIFHLQLSQIKTEEGNMCGAVFSDAHHQSKVYLHV